MNKKELFEAIHWNLIDGGYMQTLQFLRVDHTLQEAESLIDEFFVEALPHVEYPEDT